MDSSGERAVFQARAQALERFAVWQSRSRARPTPDVAVSGVAFLYDLLPEASRRRPVDARGVASMHTALAGLRSPR